MVRLEMVASFVWKNDLVIPKIAGATRVCSILISELTTLVPLLPQPEGLSYGTPNAIQYKGSGRTVGHSPGKENRASLQPLEACFRGKNHHTQKSETLCTRDQHQRGTRQRRSLSFHPSFTGGNMHKAVPGPSTARAVRGAGSWPEAGSRRQSHPFQGPQRARASSRSPEEGPQPERDSSSSPAAGDREEPGEEDEEEDEVAP